MSFTVILTNKGKAIATLDYRDNADHTRATVRETADIIRYIERNKEEFMKDPILSLYKFVRNPREKDLGGRNFSGNKYHPPYGGIAFNDIEEFKKRYPEFANDDLLGNQNFLRLAFSKPEIERTANAYYDYATIDLYYEMAEIDCPMIYVSYDVWNAKGRTREEYEALRELPPIVDDGGLLSFSEFLRMADEFNDPENEECNSNMYVDICGDVMEFIP